MPAQAWFWKTTAKYREIRKQRLFKNLEISMVMENHKFCKEFGKGGDIRDKTRMSKYHWSKLVAANKRMSKMSITFSLCSADMKKSGIALGSRVLRKAKTQWGIFCKQMLLF